MGTFFQKNIRREKRFNWLYIIKWTLENVLILAKCVFVLYIVLLHTYLARTDTYLFKMFSYFCGVMGRDIVSSCMSRR